MPKMLPCGTTIGRTILHLCLLLSGIIGHCRSRGSGDKHGNDEESRLSYLEAGLDTVLDRMASVDQRLNAMDHRMNALDHRVNSLDHRLGSVKKEGGQPSGLSRQQPSSGSGSEGKQHEENGASQDGSDPWPDVIESLPLKMSMEVAGGGGVPFRLTKVRREEAGHVTIVHLSYISPSLPTLLIKIGSYPIPVPHRELGRAVVYIPKQQRQQQQHHQHHQQQQQQPPYTTLPPPPPPPPPLPIVYFLFSDRYFSLKLNLTSEPEVDLPFPVLEISEGSDVIFQEGHDARLHFLFYVKGDTAGAVERQSADLQFLRTTSREEVNTVVRSRLYNDGSGFVNTAGDLRIALDNVGDSGGYMKGVVLVNSSDGRAEGVLEAFVILTFNCSVNCLVRQVTEQHSVNVYREGHSGPFPKGFLGFLRDDFFKPEPYATAVHCDTGPHAATCSIVCEAVGDGVLSVTVERVDAEYGDGDVDGGADLSQQQQRQRRRQQRTRLISAANGGYWGGAMLVFEELGSEDSGVYLCTAQSSSGEEITQNVTLVARRWHDDRVYGAGSNTRES